ncbi:DUF2490 domain-containing protein [Botryobacter ruber]|uniref:DUF2490 domain-containing protein n=1 Tax=Botryobacter ruber TaxID=2171629 RepID=UPI000E0A444C|nr:DUF2490 domain-containing protein [Botryobacter ruber]
MRYFLFLLLFLPFAVRAQSGRNVTHQQLVWTRYQNQLQLGSRWAIQSEVDMRRFVYHYKMHHLVMRSQGRYTFNSQVEAGAGLVYTRQYPQDSRSVSELVVPEFRVQADVTLKQATGQVNLQHRYLVEQRFVRRVVADALASDYVTSTRFRYRLQAEVPLWKGEKQSFRATIHDEVMVQTREAVKRNIFDQNRIYAGLRWGVSPKLAFELGYLKWYQQRSSGDDFYSRDILRFSILHKVQFSGAK